MTMDFADLVATVRPASMVPDEALIFSWQQMLALMDAGVSGQIIECGTWMGGCAFGMGTRPATQLGTGGSPGLHAG
jgi:hypothetical protein